MRKILIVDNNIDPPYGCAEIREQLQKAAIPLGSLELVSLRAPDSAISLNSLKQYSAAVFSGSKTRIYENAPWIDLEMELLRALHREKIPSLGICYGEQLMARVFAGEQSTGVSKTMEYGWVEIETTKEAKQSKVFFDLPAQFHSFGFHSDEVYGLPKNFRLIAKSVDCPVQAFDLLDAPMWGVQFHPERTLEEGNRGLDSKHLREPETRIINRDRASQLYDPKIAESIFANFLKEVWKHN